MSDTPETEDRSRCRRHGRRHIFGKILFVVALIGIPWAVAAHVAGDRHCDRADAPATAPE